jgi:hypothetical protein
MAYIVSWTFDGSECDADFTDMAEALSFVEHLLATQRTDIRIRHDA